MRQFHASLANRWRNSPWLRWLAALALMAALVAIFGAMAEDVWFNEGFAWDPPIILAMHSLSTPLLDSAMRSLTHLGVGGASLVAVAMGVWFLWKGRSLDAATVAVSLVGGVVLNALLKLVFARPRPLLFPPLVQLGGFSFPSGHVATAVTIYGLLAIYLWRGSHRLLALLAAAIVPLVALTRIYLGVHYPSDTLASMAYTTLWLWAVMAIRDRHARRAYVNKSA